MAHTPILMRVLWICALFPLRRTATHGGAVLLGSLQRLLLRKCAFRSNLAWLGGALAMRQLAFFHFLPSKFDILSSVFEHNEAYSGRSRA